jgi:hypothetical protein
MKNRLSTLVTLVFAMVFVLTVSSCNRGMGCPNNFSIGKLVNVVR